MNAWEDVQWRHEIAKETIRRLRETADLLDSGSHERALFSRDAVDEWRGPSRSHFDQAVEQILVRSMRLAADLRHAADQIQRADQRADEEQHARVIERQRLGGMYR